MAKKKSPNQVVAWNLKRARELKGWTQKETVEHLAEHGMEISRANYSLMEGSFARDTRLRNFTADNLVTFSLVFEVAVLWFFLPAVEEGDDADQLPAIVATAGDELDLPEYVDLVWPLIDIKKTVDPDPTVGALEKRLHTLSIILGTDITERVRASLEPQAARAVQSAIPTSLEFIRTIDELGYLMQSQLEALKGFFGKRVVDPVWAAALDEAEKAAEERREEE